jgi:hypothetical protein
MNSEFITYKFGIFNLRISPEQVENSPFRSPRIALYIPAAPRRPCCRVYYRRKPWSGPAILYPKLCVLFWMQSSEYSFPLATVEGIIGRVEDSW